jgi:hypothetical protein
MDVKKRKIWDLIGNGLLILLFAPFAILFGSAILGVPIMKVPGFGIWFMVSLAACGAVAFICSLIEGVRERKFSWIWLIVTGGLTILWGSIAWKGLIH